MGIFFAYKRASRLIAIFSSVCVGRYCRLLKHEKEYILLRCFRHLIVEESSSVIVK
jgi:hypothetical protein